MTNTTDEFIESILAATLNNEIAWEPGAHDLEEILEEIYGNYGKIYTFIDEETAANVVFASYQYYEGEVEAEEFIKEGVSILLVDTKVDEVQNEITDEDVEDTTLFEKLAEAIEAQQK